MSEFSRVFKLNGKQYLYSEKINSGDETSTRILSRWTKHPELKHDVWTPIIKKTKYGENAYSYENFTTRDIVLADNFRKSNTFDVAHRVDGLTENKTIGFIKKGVITKNTNDNKMISFLKKMKGMIKKF